MNLKLLAIIVCTILIMAIILTGIGGTVLSMVLGLLLVFVLPGYAMVNVLFPERNLERAESIALTLGISLAIAALGGLVLYLSPWKLETPSWTIFLGSITVLASIIALLRQQHMQAPATIFTKVKFTLNFHDGLFYALAAIGIAIAFALAYRGEVNQNNTDFTQLWILPSEESTSSVQVGINNHAQEEVQYHLLVKADGSLVEDIPLISLPSGETWNKSFSVPEGTSTVYAELYRLYAPVEVCSVDNPPVVCQKNQELYRQVSLTR